MADVDEETRQYLRILAESTKNSGTAGVARRLLRLQTPVASRTISRRKQYLIRCH